MKIEEIRTYLNETSKLVFRDELENLNPKQRNILKLNIFVRSRHGEYGKKIADEIISYVIGSDRPRLAREGAKETQITELTIESS